VIAPELTDAFRRDGFVVVPDLLSADEVEEFGRAVDTAVANRTRADRRSLSEKSRYEQSFLQCINLWEDAEDVRPLTFHPRVTQTAGELLGAPRIRLWHDQALYKEPGGRETDPHQDLPYWPILETDSLTAWIPFQDVDERNGATGFVPGSHAIGLRKFVNIFVGEAEDPMQHSAVSGAEPIFVKAPRGSVVYHHGLTVHMARTNRTQEVRRVHTAIYFADGSTRAPRGIHPCVDRYCIGVGEPIDSDATPIAWPRDDGSTPPRPAAAVPEDSLGRHLWPEP